MPPDVTRCEVDMRSQLAATPPVQTFHLTLKAAAKKLGIGVTLLKKVCRKHKIKRWPYRVITSLDRMIERLARNADAASRANVESLR
jgi:hypothetical protein